MLRDVAMSTSAHVQVHAQWKCSLMEIYYAVDSNVNRQSQYELTLSPGTLSAFQ